MSTGVEDLMQQLRRRERWMIWANCRGEDPHIFFPEPGGTWERAREICKQCAVLEQCREYADTLPPDTVGIFGGLDQNEREKRQRRRRRRRLAS